MGIVRRPNQDDAKFARDYVLVMVAVLAGTWPTAVWRGPLGIAITVAWVALVIGVGRFAYVRCGGAGCKSGRPGSSVAAASLVAVRAGNCGI